jgi:predicted Zn-ribbon and HTH transcriptional regulator
MSDEMGHGDFDPWDDPWDEPLTDPFWRCEECNYENHTKPMPPDREKFYKKGIAYKCPKCKSEALMPVGF